MDERRKINEENLKLRNQLNALSFDFDRLKQENSQIKEFLKIDDKNIENHFMNVAVSQSNNFNSNINISFYEMRMKIEELEDLVSQQNSVMDPFKIADLEQVIADTNREISNKDAQIEILNNKIKDILSKPNYIFDEKQACFSLSQAMREKDVLILDLKKALRDIRELDYKTKMDDNLLYNFNMRDKNNFISESKQDINQQLKIFFSYFINFLFFLECKNFIYGADRISPNNYIEKIENLSGIIFFKINFLFY